MSLLDKLPLIRGWRWKLQPVLQTVRATQEILVYEPPPPGKEIGWVVSITMLSNDAYLGLRLVFPGLDTGYALPATGGPMAPLPSGMFMDWYWRPNPMRTIGEYQVYYVMSAYPYPFQGPVKAYLSLRSGTTEPQATGRIVVWMIVIEDRNLFLKDLRKVLYGRWAPLMDLIGHVPLLNRFIVNFEKLGIRYKEEEKIEPPGIAR